MKPAKLDRYAISSKGSRCSLVQGAVDSAKFRKRSAISCSAKIVLNRRNQPVTACGVFPLFAADIGGNAAEIPAGRKSGP